MVEFLQEQAKAFGSEATAIPKSITGQTALDFNSRRRQAHTNKKTARKMLFLQKIHFGSPAFNNVPAPTRVWESCTVSPICQVRIIMEDAMIATAGINVFGQVKVGPFVWICDGHGVWAVSNYVGHTTSLGVGLITEYTADAGRC
jgi:hypothetical protein